jgi:propanediol utilization protein
LAKARKGDTMDYSKENIEALVRRVISGLKDGASEVKSEESGDVPIGVSNRHIHLSREDIDVLYGKGYLEEYYLTRVLKLKYQ